MYNWISIALELRNGLNWVYDLNRQEFCYFMCFRFTVLSLCMVFLAWNCYLSALFVRNQQSNRQGIVQFIQVRNEDLSLHRAIIIMPTSGESEEITEQEKIIGIKREKRNRKTVVTKTRHNLERLSASGKDSESIQNEIDTLWGVLEACLAVMDEQQSMYLRLGDKDNMKSIAEEAESFGKEINDVIEKAEGVVKDILEKKHADATQEGLLQTPLPKSPVQPAHSPTTSHSSSSPHSGNCNRQLKPLKVPVFSGEKSKFEDFWEMFLSLVDQGGEPANIKMARLRQSLTGTLK